MKNVVFIGDSLTSGENNNFRSYAHIFQEKTKDYNVSVLGVSGACFGDYSIYPVKESLFSMIDNNNDLIRNCDILFIEFGINDTAAVTTGYVDLTKVYISVVMSIDYIKQLNDNVEIIFLFVDPSEKYSLDYMSYLKCDYFKNYLIERTLDLDYWTYCYNKIRHFDKDLIHPVEQGYAIIADSIIDYLNLRKL